MKLTIGNKITWNSAAGQLVGTICDIVLDLNAAQKTIPWMVIDVKDKQLIILMCATDDYLKMMKVEVL